MADGLAMEYTIECPKHIGRFDFRTGATKAASVCVNFKTYSIKMDDGEVFIEVLLSPHRHSDYVSGLWILSLNCPCSFDVSNSH